MRLLIIASTPFEIAPLIAYLEGGSFEQVQSSRFRKGNHEVHLLVSGVGIALTTYHLTRALRDQVYDLVIQAGIAGSFDRSIPLGEVVQVVSEQFADLGVEEADGSFTDVFSLGLLDRNFPPFENGRLLHPVAESKTHVNLAITHVAQLPSCPVAQQYQDLTIDVNRKF